MVSRLEVGIQVSLVLAVLAAAVYGIVATAVVEGPASGGAAPGPDASLIASTAPIFATASPSAAPTVAPSPTASPSPAATAAPLALQPYSFNGRAYTGVRAGAETTFLSPFDGTVEIRIYQLIDNEIREFTDVRDQPFYPYVIVNTADRRFTLRPGQLERATVVLAKNGPVRAGDALFRVVGDGASSWKDFYDDTVSFNIVASLVATATGGDLDAAPLIRTTR